MTAAAPQPYTVQIRASLLEDLGARLADVRWPDEVSEAGWDYGVPRGYVQELVDYWRDGYDWRASKAALIRGSHFATRDATDLLVDDIRTFYRGLR